MRVQQGRVSPFLVPIMLCSRSALCRQDDSRADCGVLTHPDWLELSFTLRLSVENVFMNSSKDDAFLRGTSGESIGPLLRRRRSVSFSVVSLRSRSASEFVHWCHHTLRCTYDSNKSHDWAQSLENRNPQRVSALPNHQSQAPTVGCSQHKRT